MRTWGPGEATKRGWGGKNGKETGGPQLEFTEVKVWGSNGGSGARTSEFSPVLMTYWSGHSAAIPKVLLRSEGLAPTAEKVNKLPSAEESLPTRDRGPELSWGSLFSSVSGEWGTLTAKPQP